MTKITENRFDGVWSAVQKYDKISGIFLFKEDSLMSRTEKLYHKRFYLHLIVVLFLMISTLFVKKFSLLFVILIAANYEITLTFPYGLAVLMKNKITINQIFEWFQCISDPSGKYFHPVIRNVVRDKIEQQHRFTRKFVKYIEITCQICFVGSFMVVLLPEKIHPRFSPPLPFYLPFKEQDNWVSFGVTMLVQTFITNDITIYTILIGSIFICLFSYLLFMLDIIKESVEMLGKELQMRDIVHIEPNEPSTSKGISLSTLVEINAKTKSETMSLVQWLQIITDMLSDINQKLNFLNEMFSGVFLLIEIASFSSLMLSSLLLTIWKQQLIYGFGCNVVSVFLFAICAVNEKILERYEAIEEAFYNISWYQLSPKDRKLFLLAMNCGKIQRGFTAMSVHEVTVERFGFILKTAYSNYLILKDLINKNTK